MPYMQCTISPLRTWTLLRSSLGSSLYDTFFLNAARIVIPAETLNQDKQNKDSKESKDITTFLQSHS